MKQIPSLQIFISVLTCVHVSTFPTPNSTTFSVTLYEFLNFTGNYVEVSGGKCLSISDYPVLSNTVRSINVTNGCVNLYISSESCEGTHIVAKSGTYNVNQIGYFAVHPDAIKSIGPCLETCHPSLIERLESPRHSTYVTLYSNHYGSITQEDRTIQLHECVEVSNIVKVTVNHEKYRNSFAFISNTRNACVELYGRRGCMGNSQQYTGESRTVLEDIEGTEEIQSISLCGYNCITKCGKPKTAEEVAKDTEATVYSKGESSGDDCKLDDRRYLDSPLTHVRPHEHDFRPNWKIQGYYQINETIRNLLEEIRKKVETEMV